MILVKVKVFAVLKILHNLVSMQESFHASNCWSNQNYERFPMWPNLYWFIFNFQKHLTVKTHLVFKIENAASFVKISFYGTRGGCIKMRKDLETFHANKGYKLAIAVFITILPFSKKKLVVHFSNVISQKQGLADSYFWYENESIQHCLSCDLRQMKTFLILEFHFFESVFVFSSPGPSPVLRQCLIMIQIMHFIKVIKISS